MVSMNGKFAPQGYSDSPAIFQKKVNEALGDMMWKRAIPYIDYIIIFNKSFKQHLLDLEELFNRLSEANFFLKLRKCEFLMESMEYLGYTMSKEGVRPSSGKVHAVVNMKAPIDVKDIQRFLGLGSFYCKYIQFYANRTCY